MTVFQFVGALSMVEGRDEKELVERLLFKVRGNDYNWVRDNLDDFENLDTGVEVQDSSEGLTMEFRKLI